MLIVDFPLMFSLPMSEFFPPANKSFLICAVFWILTLDSIVYPPFKFPPYTFVIFPDKTFILDLLTTPEVSEPPYIFSTYVALASILVSIAPLFNPAPYTLLTTPPFNFTLVFSIFD